MESVCFSCLVCGSVPVCAQLRWLVFVFVFVILFFIHRSLFVELLGHVRVSLLKFRSAGFGYFTKDF